jgi:hypothetical protein
MTAAELTPTSVTKTPLYGTDSTGTPVRMIRYIVKLTKVTQNDWFVAATYCPGTLMIVDGFSIDTNGVQEAPTYTATGTKIVLASAGTGTTYIEAICKVD